MKQIWRIANKSLNLCGKIVCKNTVSNPLTDTQSRHCCKFSVQVINYILRLLMNCTKTPNEMPHIHQNCSSTLAQQRQHRLIQADGNQNTTTDSCMQIHHVRRKRFYSIPGITLRKLDTVSYFLTGTILILHCTKKLENFAQHSNITKWR